MFTNVFFLIPLIARKHSQDWRLVESNLDKVLTSIAQQTDSRWEAIIVHQGVPNVRVQDPRIRLVEASFPVVDSLNKGALDKYRKRKLAASLLKKEGKSGFFFGLDADDLVHKDFVKSILQDEEQADAYVVQSGIKVDFADEKYVFLSDGFFRTCGSCFTIGLQNHELPDDHLDKHSVYSKCVTGKHALHHEHAAQQGKRFKFIDFPAVAYSINHAASLYSLKRDGKIRSLTADDESNTRCMQYFKTFFCSEPAN